MPYERKENDDVNVSTVEKTEIKLAASVSSISNSSDGSENMDEADELCVEKVPTTSKFATEYDVPPKVSQSTVLCIGFVLFLLAKVWPPSILFVAYIASMLIPTIYRENDDSCKRRQLFQEFCGPNTLNLPENFREIPSNIQLEQKYWVNKRGMCLSTAIMTPKNEADIKAVIFYCHGYSDHNSFIKVVDHQRFVNQGIACVYIEYEGHGRSDGQIGLIENWDNLIEDVSDYFQEVAAKRFPNQPRFLFGESMGGAIAYMVHGRIGHLFRGVVFGCPMCKISETMLPPKWVIKLLRHLVDPNSMASFVRSWPIAPSNNNLANLTFRLAEKKFMILRCPLIYGRRPRLVTAYNLLDVTKKVSGDLKNFDAPFLVLHGKADRVTDPKISECLYNESKSKDKTIKLYDGVWHAISHGETDENVDRYFKDITQWVLPRATNN